MYNKEVCQKKKNYLWRNVTYHVFRKNFERKDISKFGFRQSTYPDDTFPMKTKHWDNFQNCMNLLLVVKLEIPENSDLTESSVLQLSLYRFSKNRIVKVYNQDVCHDKSQILIHLLVQKCLWKRGHVPALLFSMCIEAILCTFRLVPGT